ncbi:hypothetical protein [Roseomonas elaeocarpi]|uniref:Uncharacterized protein n=1 Tax=Roseomonas elaeocarpi TaxID=907779 RepID=A0ABV6JPZ6_9PROT
MHQISFVIALAIFVALSTVLRVALAGPQRDVAADSLPAAE